VLGILVGIAVKLVVYEHAEDKETSGKLPHEIILVSLFA
jgi:hypothetical protein